MSFHKRELRIRTMLSFSRVLDRAKGDTNIFQQGGVVGLITVFDAILTSRQTCLK